MVPQTNKAPNIEEFKKILRKHDLRATRQRLAVHSAMLAIGHASADMIAEEIEKEGTADVTIASVYNILSQLALLGIYHHRMSANNKMYFDVNTFRHIHLYDYVNNTYKDVIDDEITDYIDSTLGKRKFRGYKIETVDIQIVCRPSKTRAKKQDENLQ